LEIKKVNGATAPDSIAIALISLAWIESTPQSTSSSSSLFQFDVKSNNWKSESSGWTYTIPVSNANQVSRIAVIFLSNSRNTGALYLNSVKKCQNTVVTASPSISKSLSPSPSSSSSDNGKAFVSRSGTTFSWGGCPFYYAGTNNYYMTYQSTFMVTDVLDSAQKMGFNVIRVFSFLDRGSLSSPNIIDSPFYYHYWDSQRNAPGYNDGSTGLQRVDFILSEASKRGLKLILTFTNNWREFGGMDQYCKWYGLSYHSDFYTDQRVKNAYKAWISHLVYRRNTINGR